MIPSIPAGRHQPGPVRPPGRERRQASTGSTTSTSGPAMAASAGLSIGSSRQPLTIENEPGKLFVETGDFHPILSSPTPAAASRICPSRRPSSAPIPRSFRRRDFRSRAQPSGLAARGSAPAAGDGGRGQRAACAAMVASRAPIASRAAHAPCAAMSSIEGEFASSERARPTISALVGM